MADLGREDRAWFLEAVALDLHARGSPLHSSWVDDNGRRLSLDDFVLAELELLALDERLERTDLLPEFGVHAVGAVARVVKLTAENPPDPDLRLRAHNSVDRSFARLLFLGRTRNELPLLYKATVAGHLLELFFSEDIYKPRRFDPESWVLETPRTPEEVRVLELIAEMERFIEGEGRKPFGVLTHGLAGLRLMAEVLPGAPPARPGL